MNHKREEEKEGERMFVCERAMNQIPIKNGREKKR